MLWLWIFLAYIGIAILLVRPIYAYYIKKGYAPYGAKEKAILRSALWLLGLTLAALAGLIKFSSWLFFRDTKVMRAKKVAEAEAAQKEADLRALYHSEPDLLPEAERNRIERHIKWEKEIEVKEKRISGLVKYEELSRDRHHPYHYASELRELNSLRGEVALLREKMKA